MIIGIVVGVVMLSTVLYPVVTSASQDTVYQTDYEYRATTTIGNYNYTCDEDALYLNGSAITYKDYSSDQYSIGVSSEVVSLTWREQNLMWGSSVASGVATNSTALDINADGSWTLNYGESSTASSATTTQIEKGVFAKNDGELAVYPFQGSLAPTFSVPEGTELIMFDNYGQVIDSSDKTWAFAYRATILGNAVTIDYAVIYDNATTLDVSNILSISLNGSITTENGLTTYTSVSPSITLTGYNMQVRNLVAVPYEYKVNNEYADLFGIIPILFVVALILGTISIIWSRRE